MSVTPKAPAATEPEVAKSALHKAAKQVGYHQAMAKLAMDAEDDDKAASHTKIALGLALIIDHTLGKFTPAWNECHDIAAKEWDRLINPDKVELFDLSRN
jgi:hypothetical protein